MAKSRLRQTAFTIAKLGITTALVYWLLSDADFTEIGATLSRLDTASFVTAVAVMLLSSLAACIRWWLLLRHADTHARFAQVLPSYYLGLFYNNLLPTGVGGDIVRTIHLHQRGLGLKALAASMILDRGIGLIAMLMLATTCAAFLPHTELSAPIRNPALAFLAVCLGGIALAFTPWVGTAIAWLQRRYRTNRVRHGALESVMMCYSYRSKPALLLLATLLSFIAQSLAISAYIVLGHVIGLSLSPVTYFVIVPIVLVAGMLPISLGGLGVREGVLVSLLVTFGVDRQLAIVLSLLYLLVFWLSTLPGASVLLMRAPTTSQPAHH